MDVDVYSIVTAFIAHVSLRSQDGVGFDSQENKLPSYRDPSFTKIRLG